MFQPVALSKKNVNSLRPRGLSRLPASVGSIRSRTRQRGWTLFEAGLGACVVAVLALGTSAWARHSADDHRQTDALTGAEAIHAAATSWRQESNKSDCPTVALLSHEGYLASSRASADPWGERFRVHCTAESLVVYSAGPDAKLHTPDDVRFPR